MTNEERSNLAQEIVEYFNPDMGDKWDTKMYEQKAKVLSILINKEVKKRARISMSLKDAHLDK